MKNDKEPVNLEREFREYHTDFSGLFFSSSRLLYEERSEYQKVEVFENPYFGRILMLDGLVQTTEKDEYFYHEMIVHPGMIVHPSPKNILIIGGGDGGTLREVLRYPVESVTLVEIDARVIKVAKKYFPWLEPGLEDSRSHLIIQDGLRFLEESPLAFDVIIIDSSEPVGPSSVLHGKDFYQTAKKRLNREGIILAQLGSLFFLPKTFGREISVLRDVFGKPRLFIGPVPTYPGGTWIYGFLTDDLEPQILRRDPPPNLLFFNKYIHNAAFALPDSLLL